MLKRKSLFVLTLIVILSLTLPIFASATPKTDKVDKADKFGDENTPVVTSEVYFPKVDKNIKGDVTASTTDWSLVIVSASADFDVDYDNWWDPFDSMKISKIVVLVIIIIIGVIFLTIGWFKQKTTFNSEMRNPKQTTRFRIGISMIDQENKKILKAVKIDNNQFKGRFLIETMSSEDIYYDIILINNFKQVDFSLDGKKKNKKHTIFFPKTSEKNSVKTIIEVSTDNIESDLNDAALIFLRKTNDTNTLNRRRMPKIHIKRFAFYNSFNRRPTNLSYSSDYKTVKGELSDENLLVFEKQFDEITANHFENHNLLTVLNKLKAGEKVKLNTYINLKKSIEGSPSFNEYIKDQKLNVKQTFAILSLLDGEIQPLYYSPVEETVKFYEVDMDKPILISPELKVTQKGIHGLHLIVLAYPYSDPESLIGTYKMASWSTAIISYEIPINVIDP